MARYRHYDYGQKKLLAVSFEQQILPGTFEYTLHQMIEEHIDLSVFDPSITTTRPVPRPTIRASCSRSCCTPTLRESRRVARSRSFARTT